MSKKDKITHDGVVVSVEGNYVLVSIKREEACATCHAKSLCHSTEEEQILEIYTAAPQIFSHGEIVKVSLTQRDGMKAIGMLYVVPFVLILMTLLICNGFAMEQLYSGLLSLGVGAVYMSLLYIFRSKIDRDIDFEIEKLK